MVSRIGLVGCGNISDIYLLNAPRFRDIRFVACADIGVNVTAASARMMMRVKSVSAKRSPLNEA